MPHMPLPPEDITVLEDRLINTTAPLTGGGDLSADRTLGIDTFTQTVKGAVPPPTTITNKFLRDDGTWQDVLAGGAPSTRLINTTAPLTGGGDLSADRTLAISNFTTSVRGAVPPPGTVEQKFLRDDGTWQLAGDNDIIDIFKVNDYGADPTGVANSTTAIRAAITAAAANSVSTGRYSCVSFGAGVYTCATRTVAPHFNVTGMSKIIFQGATGWRTRLNLSGDSLAADWYLFQVQGGSSFIHFRDLWLNADELTNPDPIEQNHLLQIGPQATHVTVDRCKFTQTIGDGIRLLGEFANEVRYVSIRDSEFYECERSSVAVQRWVRNLTLTGCRMIGGTDQALDFEPTGFLQTADAGGSSSTLIDASADFVAWGIVVGDLIFHNTEAVFCVISAVTTTTLTIGAGATTWASAPYSFPKQCSDHIVSNNTILAGPTAQTDILVTLTATHGCTFSNNAIEGCLNAVDASYLLIDGNRVLVPRSAQGDAGIVLFRRAIGSAIRNNRVVLRSTTYTNQRVGILISHSSGQPVDAIIEGNSVHMLSRGIGISVESAARTIIRNNNVVLNTPGDTGQSVAVSVRPTDLDIEFAEVTNNSIRAESGAWRDGIVLNCNPNDIKACIVGGGTIANCTNPTIFQASGGGVFVRPPMILPTSIESGSSPIIPNATTPWFQIAGIGGTAAGKDYMPGSFWGNDSPEGVIAAAVGSTARPRNANGTSIAYAYQKQSGGTGATGWVAVGGSTTTKVYSTVTVAVAANANASLGDGNLDTALGDLSGGTFLTDYDVYRNGQLMRPGADASANHDYYPGTSLAAGQLKFEANLLVGDVLTVVRRS